jgi:hypothetical protein
MNEIESEQNWNVPTVYFSPPSEQKIAGAVPG